MRIVELSLKYEEQVKNLLVELQEYIAEIDDWKLNIMTKTYSEQYYSKIVEECDENGKIFLAIDNEKVIGLICGYINRSEKYDDCYYLSPKSCTISELIVTKNIRSKGVGTMLINYAEKYFKNQGCEYVYVDVFEPNNSALKFYEKNNYQTRMRTLGKKL